MPRSSRTGDDAARACPLPSTSNALPRPCQRRKASLGSQSLAVGRRNCHWAPMPHSTVLRRDQMGDTGCPRSPRIPRLDSGFWPEYPQMVCPFPDSKAREERRRHDAWPLPGWELLLLAVLVAIVAMNIARSPYYLGVGNIVNLFQLSIEKIIVALMLTLIIVNAGFDLSVASIMGLAAAVAVAVPARRAAAAGHPGGHGRGGAGGPEQRLLDRLSGMPSLAVTLAGLIGYRGIARILLEDRAVGNYRNGSMRWASSRCSARSPCRSSFSVVRRDRGRAASLGARPTGLRDGQRLETARYSGVRVSRSSCPVRRVGRGRRARGPALRGPARIRARRHRARLRARHHHHRSARRRQHLRGVGQPDRGRSAILVILNLRNGMGLANITGNTQTSVIGALLILSVLAPNLVQMAHGAWKGAGMRSPCWRARRWRRWRSRAAPMRRRPPRPGRR